MNLITLIERLKSDDLVDVAAATGVPYETLRRISKGKTVGPRVTTVERIAAHYERKRQQKAAV